LRQIHKNDKRKEINMEEIKDLIESYQALINKWEIIIRNNPAPRVMHLIGKVDILKKVIIDLKNLKGIP